MTVRRVMGTEVEYGISVQGQPTANPMVASSQVVNAYASATLKARRARWDFEEESPLRDARGFDMSRQIADNRQLRGAVRPMCSSATRRTMAPTASGSRTLVSTVVTLAPPARSELLLYFAPRSGERWAVGRLATFRQPAVLANATTLYPLFGAYSSTTPILPPPRSTTRTRAAWCTATSSRPTC